jgi:hypothetical protein
MKNKERRQRIIIFIVFFVMIILIIGVQSGVLLNQEKTNKIMLQKSLEKLKHHDSDSNN